MSKTPSSGLKKLVAANAPLWGAEAEVCRTYFRSSTRNAHSDCAWIARQCYKELVDGALFRMLEMQGEYPLEVLGPGGVPVDEGTRTELAHFLAYAEAFRVAGDPDQPRLDLATILAADWPENGELMALRREHCRQSPDLGRRAHAFTEGGYCTLYSTGMELAQEHNGDPGLVDRAIAVASKVVYDDEWEHMLEGIADLDDDNMSDRDWARLCELTSQQSRLRIRMRNAQFGFPVSRQRMAELEAGHAEPIVFDWERAGMAAPG